MNFKTSLLLMFALLCSISLSSQSERKQVRVLFIGDSITDGNWGGVNQPLPSSKRALWDMNHIYGHGYVYLCASYYMDKHPGRYAFYNRGISGNTLYDMAARWQNDAIDIHPDVLSILIGTNDVEYYLSSDKKYPFDFAAWDKTYRSLLDRSLTANHKLRIVLATPFVAKVGQRGDRADYVERSAMISKMDTIVRRIAHDYHAILISYDELVRKTIKKHTEVPTNYWIWDGVHPTAQMHYLMSKMWIKRVDL